MNARLFNRDDATTVGRLIGGIRAWSPLLVVALLIVMPWMFPTETEFSEEALVRNIRIADAVDDAPWIINDRWYGRDFPVPVAAIRILRPTAILSRAYEARDSFNDDEGPLPTGRVGFVMVHCSDIRDMQGHYPPVCYPAQGWEPSEGNARVLDFSCRMIPNGRLTRYEYSIGGGFEERQERSVLNLFLLPNGVIAPDLDSVRDMKTRRATSAHGIAQVQLVVDQSMDDAACITALGELVDGMPELFGLLLGREEESDDVTPGV